MIDWINEFYLYIRTLYGHKNSALLEYLITRKCLYFIKLRKQSATPCICYNPNFKHTHTHVQRFHKDVIGSFTEVGFWVVFLFLGCFVFPQFSTVEVFLNFFGNFSKIQKSRDNHVITIIYPIPRFNNYSSFCQSHFLSPFLLRARKGRLELF